MGEEGDEISPDTELWMWVNEGLERIVEECECALGHMKSDKDEDVQSVLLHLYNMHLGITAMIEAMQENMPGEWLATVVKTVLETRLGLPLEEVDMGDLGPLLSGTMFRINMPVVPDDISELEEN